MFGRVPPFARGNPQQDEMDAAALRLYRAAKAVVESWRLRDEPSWDDLTALRLAVAEAAKYAEEPDA